MQNADTNLVWQMYQNGVQYKQSIHLYDTVDRNERYFAGDQWHGVNAPDLPKPVTNFLKRACQQKIASVRAYPTKVLFTSYDFPVPPGQTQAAVTPQTQQQLVQNYAPAEDDEKRTNMVSDVEMSTLNAMFEMDWARLNMDGRNLDGLQDACITGDYILYTYWNAHAETGQAAKGQIEVEEIDNVNYYPCNPNERDPQKQPSIIIARRELVSDVKREAKQNGVSEDDIRKISGDSDYQYQSGDMSKIENQDDSAQKCVTIVYFWKDHDTGHVWAQKQTKEVVLRDAWDTMLSRFPFAMMNWERRKNCCHGQAEVTGLIPNQHYINFENSMIALYTRDMAIPKVVVNRAAIGNKKWSTKVNEPFEVNGDPGAAVKYIQPASIAADAYNHPQSIMESTLEMMGTSDAALGNAQPNNSQALMIAVQQSQVPIQTVQNRFYEFIREFARNWLDMVLAYYKTSRFVLLRDDSGTPLVYFFDADKIRNMAWTVDVKAGEGVTYSQLAGVQLLGNALQSGQITFAEYLELIPSGYIQGMDKLKQMEAQRQQQLQQVQMMQASQGSQNQTPQQPGAQQSLPPALLNKLQAIQQQGGQQNV